MSTYSAHKGDSGADVGLDPARAHAHATHIVAGHLKLEWVGVVHPQPDGVGVEEVVAELPEPEGAEEMVAGHLDPEGVYHPELEGVGGIFATRSLTG